MTIKRFVLTHGRQLGTAVGLMMVCLVLTIASPHFLTVSNLLNVAQQTSINAIIAAGMTFVIISAGIDLSVGSILAFTGVVLGSLVTRGFPLPVCIVGALILGLICGFLNGALIAFGRLPPFIATLGMMSVARGGALLYTQGRPISGFPDSFRFLATGELFH